MSLTIQQFRQDPARVDALAAALALPIVREALEVLRENGPEFRRQVGLTPTDATIRLGHICGYAEHHQHFEELGERWPLRASTLEDTYETPDPPEPEE